MNAISDRAMLFPGAPARALPWLIAIAGFAFDIAAFWPGQMSFDSGYTWWQARGGETTNIAPPVLIYLWRALDVLHEGPGLVFALHLALFWSGLALLVDALRIGRVRTIVADARRRVRADDVVAARACVDRCRPVLGVAVRRRRARRRRRRRAGASGSRSRLIPLLYAGAVRHNALPAIVPLAIWIGWLVAGHRSRMHVALVAAAVCAVSFACASLINAQVQRHVPLWPAAAEWDLAALSVASGEMLLPPFMIGPGMTVDELAGAFRALEHRADAAEHDARHARSVHGRIHARSSSMRSAMRGSTRSARIPARGSRITGSRLSRCSTCTIRAGRAS